MIYKQYGKTNKMVSAVGFGGMRFDTTKSMEENAALVLYAREKGINYLDTAPGYCDDTSEIIMGKAIGQMKNREDFYVSTKLMPAAAKNKQEYQDAVKKSLDRLQTEYIDFYHIWCLRNMDQYRHAMQPDMQYDALMELKEQGIIKHIVCSSHQPGSQIRQIVDDNKVEGILMGVNILNSEYRWDGVMACKEKGLGTVAMNPLGGGAIPTHEDRFRFLCKEGETPTEAALRFIISGPIDIALVGLTTKEHVDTACKVADSATPFTDADLLEIRKNLGANMNEACTGCGYCLKGCPVHINIAAYMQVYNDYILFGKTDEQMTESMKFQNSFGLLANSKVRASECTECGSCETECTQHLNIISRLKQVAEWEKDVARS